MPKRPEVQRFREQYRALVIKGDSAAFERLLDEHKPHMPAEEKRELVEEFKHASVEALRHRWRYSK